MFFTTWNINFKFFSFSQENSAEDPEALHIWNAILWQLLQITYKCMGGVQSSNCRIPRLVMEEEDEAENKRLEERDLQDDLNSIEEHADAWRFSEK